MGKTKPTKPFFKINFEDLEIAENFFENEKHFSEFLLAVSYYYRGIDYKIKQKFVQRYFNTYKKTMDFIIESKKTGSNGANRIRYPGSPRPKRCTLVVVRLEILVAQDRKSTRLNSSHSAKSRMPSSA